ncbi:MAG: alpha-galactosidase [Spirochaetia bacterium]
MIGYSSSRNVFSITGLIPGMDVDGVFRRFIHTEDDITLGTKARDITGNIENTDLELTVHYEQEEKGFTLRAEIRHTGRTSSPHSLGRFYFLKESRIFCAADSYRDAVILLQSGKCGNNFNFPLKDLSDTRTSEIFTVCYMKNISAIHAGFISFHRAFCRAEWNSESDESCGSVIFSSENSREESEAQNAYLSVYCDFNGCILNPGETTSSETFYLAAHKNPFSVLERWADRTAEQYKPQFKQDPPVGWLGGWGPRDGFFVENMEKIILENIDAINRRLSGFGIEYIWVSGANLKGNTPGNWTLENRRNFPRGFSALIDKLDETGKKLGFWIAPFWMGETSDFLNDVSDGIAVLHAKKAKSERGFSIHQTTGMESIDGIPRNYFLDPSHPVTNKFLREVFTFYRSLGIRYFMIDFLDHGINREYDFYDKSLIPGPEAYRKAMRTIRDAAGPDIYLLSSSGPTYYNIGLVDGARSALDFGEGRPFLKLYSFYPAGYLANNWDLIKKVARDWACTYFTGRKLYQNDAFNVLSLGKQISLNEARFVASLFGLSGNPLILGDDIFTLAEERLNLVKKCLPQYKGNLRPLDLWESVFPDVPHVYGMSVETDWDSWYVLGVFNPDNSPRHENIEFERLGLGAGKQFTVFDFWNDHCLGSASGEFTAVVPPRDVKVFRITEVREHPWIVGSDMHLSQGGVEMAHLKWDQDISALKGICTRPKGEQGNLYLRLPPGWAPADFTDLYTVQEVTQDLDHKHFRESVLKGDYLVREKTEPSEEGQPEKMIIALLRIEFPQETVDFTVRFNQF